MEWLKVFSAIVLGFAIGARHYQPTAAAESNSSESDDEDDEVTVQPLTLAWIEKPPYITSLEDGSLNKLPRGLIPEAIMQHITIECGRNRKIAYNVNILRPGSEFGMIELLRQNKVHIAAPVFEPTNDRKYSEFSFLKLDDYPGTDYITVTDEIYALRVMLDAVKKSWPLLAVTLLFTAIAGIIMWALVGFFFYSQVNFTLNANFYAAVASKMFIN